MYCVSFFCFLVFEGDFVFWVLITRTKKRAKTRANVCAVPLSVCTSQHWQGCQQRRFVVDSLLKEQKHRLRRWILRIL